MLRPWFALALTGCVPHLYSPADTDPVDTDWSWTPPENDWASCDGPAVGLEGEGFAEGQVIPDFRLQDQKGQTVSLWQFGGCVVVVDISTMWCAPCQELAQTTEETYQDYAGDGFMYLTLLAQDVQGNPPDQADLVTWADAFDITAPVVADPESGYTGPAVPDGQYPVLLVVGRDLKVAKKVGTPEDAALRAAIEAALD